MGEPPPRSVPLMPGTPPASPDRSARTQSSGTEGVPLGYIYIHIPLPRAQCFNLDLDANERMRDKDFIPDLLTDASPSTG